MNDRLSKLKELSQYEGKDKVVPSREYLEIKGDEGNRKILESGFRRLNRTLGGFVPGELVVVAGPTGEGKTTLCQSLTADFAQEGARSLWFSYEMQPARMIKKLGEDYPVFYLPLELENSGMDWIENRVEESIAKFSTWAVFIDHLHFLIGMDELAHAGNTSILLGMILRGLKKIALKTETVIFLVSHLRKLQAGEEPTLADIRDSSFAGQESDSVMLIWRKMSADGQYEDEALLKIAKNRKRGELGTIPLTFQDNRFYELAPHD